MVIVETSVFTRQVQSLLTDEEYRQLQIVLLARPDMGATVPGSGGLRKLRWIIHGKGKSGGTRVIYYWAIAHDKILLLYIYPKSEGDDLSPKQISILRTIVEEEYS